MSPCRAVSLMDAFSLMDAVSLMDAFSLMDVRLTEACACAARGAPQSLLSRFSEENGRLAKENDRLRANRQLLSQEHGEVRTTRRISSCADLRFPLTRSDIDSASASQAPFSRVSALCPQPCVLSLCAQPAPSSVSPTCHPCAR
jgi:hypothetical protein